MTCLELIIIAKFPRISDTGEAALFAITVKTSL